MQGKHCNKPTFSTGTVSSTLKMPHTLQKLVFYVGLYKQYEGAHNIVIEPYQIIIGTWGLTTLRVTCIMSCHKHQEL